MKKKSFRLWTVLLSVFLMVAILPAVVYAGGEASVEIISQPNSISGYAGEEKTMKVTVSNGKSYQWQRSSDEQNWANIGETNANYSGAKTRILTIKISKTTAEFFYRCVIKNSAGSVSSDTATVRLIKKPSITSQPKNISGYAGEEKTMSVTATNATSYQWQRSSDGQTWNSISSANANYSGVKTDSMTVQLSQTTAGFLYRCVVRNSDDSATSETAKVTLAQPPVISEHPKNISGRPGDEKTMSIVATNATSYQWQRSSDGQTWNSISASNSNYSGVKTDTMSIKISQTTADFEYRCVAMNSKSTTSKSATIRLIQTPIISKQPKNVSGHVGDERIMSIETSNATSYQWQRSADGVNWSGISATNANYSGVKTDTMTVKVSQTTESFVYRCVATNGDGSTMSNPVSVTLQRPPVIATQPKSISGFSGEQKTMSVESANATSYQWQRSADGVNWSGISATNANYSGVKTDNMTAIISQTTESFIYRCVVTNSDGSVFSKTVSITVLRPPVFTVHPKDVSGYAGDQQIMCVTAKEADSYQWQRSSDGETWNSISETNANYSGVKTDTMTIKISSTSEAYLYRCVAINSDGSTASVSANVSMIRLPKITRQPKMIIGYSGEVRTMSVDTAHAVSFQWQRSSDGTTWKNISTTNPNYSGIKTATMTVIVNYTTSVYEYRCVIKNAAGDSLESNPAGIDVITVTYDGNGGLVLTPDDKLSKICTVYPAGGEIICASGDWDLFAEREGYTFAGWYYDKACTSQVWNFSPDKDTRIYAKWIKGNAAGVFFDAMGGSIVMGGDLYPVYSTLTERNKPFGHGQTAIKEGYKLVCWCLDMECTQAVEPYDYVVTDDVWFYARWAEAVKVTWNANGGIITEMNSATVVWTVFKDQLMGAEPNVEREGYTFGGWYLDSACTIPVDVYYFFIPTDDVTLYAKWA